MADGLAHRFGLVGLGRDGAAGARTGIAGQVTGGEDFEIV